MRSRGVIVAALIASALGAGQPALGAPGADASGVAGHVDRVGRHFVDGNGRTMAFHGFVLPYKRPPYLVDAAGFGEDDADLLAREGFNLMQLRFTYGGVEPGPGRYDTEYVDRVVATARTLMRQGIRVLLQSNQGNYGPVTHGQGFPDWATFTDGMPNPALGFGPNFLANPALLRAWDNLWANRVTARGEGIQEGYAKGLAQVVSRLRDEPLFLGLDMINEPWLGSDYPGCFPVGRETQALCPRFDREKLAPFYERTIRVLRPLMPRQLLFYEPAPTFDLGLPTYLSDVGGEDPRTAFTFHAYCSLDGGGADLPSAPASPQKEAQCDKEEGRVFDNAVAHGEAQDVPVLSSEFGATRFAASTARLMADHDRRLLSWTYAAYCCRARTEEPSGDVILDPRKPPTPDNLDQDKLHHLVRPYPGALTGTATAIAFDPGTARFVLRYRTARPGGGAYPADLPSIVNVPARHYPQGYDVAVRGGRVVSPPGARRLRVLTEPGAAEVEVTITRATAAPYRCVSRRVVRLRLPVPPRDARAVRVSATVEGRPRRARRAGDGVVAISLRGREAGRYRVRALIRWTTAAGIAVRKERRATITTCNGGRA